RSLGEPGDLVSPTEPGVREPVQQHHERSLTLLDVVHRDAVDRRVSVRPAAHPPSPLPSVHSWVMTVTSAAGVGEAGLPPGGITAPAPACTRGPGRWVRGRCPDY